VDVSEVLADLVAEQAALDETVSGFTNEQWVTDTASPRWRVKEQIAHLAYFDNSAAIAITDPEGFKALASELWEIAVKGDEAMDNYSMGSYLSQEPSAMLDAWRADRAALAQAAAALENDTRVPWYGPSMGSKSFLTARLMEAWAHGQDIVDAVGLSRESSDRIRHIAQLGFITRGWTYQNRKLDAPPIPVSVTLESPSGEVWTFGPADAPETVTGAATDYSQVITQRRHLDDTKLVVDGASARDWLLKAQCFAGPPTDGPAPTTA
jgi:uncharacterized protein (TIGR03084 family)